MFEFKENYDINDLRAIMTVLRSENGCPWDKEQDHKSIRMDVLEEAYEVMEAIDAENSELLREELGDLLLQVVFHSELERETGSFDFDTVCDGICKKLIYRHPHVFGNVEVSGSKDVLKNWDSLKSKSKGETTATERLQSVPKLLPALMRAEKVGKRAGNAGFDFPDTASLLSSLKSEISELEEAISLSDEEKIEDELGDVLFSCANLSRFLHKDSEKSLTFAINKFIMRFREVETLAAEKGKKLSELPQDELDSFWEMAKKK